MFRHSTGPVLDVLTKEFTMVAERSNLVGDGADHGDKRMEIKTKVFFKFKMHLQIQPLCVPKPAGYRRDT